MKKSKSPGGMSAGRHKRQVKGRKHKKRVDVYFSPDEHQVVELAAQKSGLSRSFYCSAAILRAAMADLGGPRISPIELPPVSSPSQK